MTHWRAGSRACNRLNFCEVFFSFFFFAKKIEPATWRWASYEALSQLRGIEPATWHWASYVALSQQGSFELWASKEAVSQQGSFELHHIYIYTPMQSQPCNILDLGKSNFFEGDTYLWAGAGMWNLTFELPEGMFTKGYPRGGSWYIPKKKRRKRGLETGGEHLQHRFRCCHHFAAHHCIAL